MTEKVHLLNGYEFERLDERFGLFKAPNNKGYVTVDYADRAFRTGIVRYGPCCCSGREYKGHGWKKRLELDAQTYLAGLLA